MMQSSTLYLVSLVLRSVGCLAVFLIACRGWLILKEIKGGPSVSFLPISVNVTGSSYLPASTVNRLLMVAVVCTGFGVGFSAWTIFDRFRRSDIVALENVHVLDKYDPSSFCMEVESRGKWIPFSAHTCDPMEADVVPGVTLPVFNYVVDSHLQCFDWNARHAGYTVWRNHAKQPILSTFPRPSTASCSTQADRSTEAAARP